MRETAFYLSIVLSFPENKEFGVIKPYACMSEKQNTEHEQKYAKDLKKNTTVHLEPLLMTDVLILFELEMQECPLIIIQRCLLFGQTKNYSWCDTMDGGRNNLI